jgi:hypothetical protein
MQEMLSCHSLVRSYDDDARCDGRWKMEAENLAAII